MRWLFKLNTKGIKFDLQGTLSLNKLMGNPCKYLDGKVIHIAGTNGKGSVASILFHALASSGIKAGLYTSPHISTFRERIVVGYPPQMISESQTVDILEPLMRDGVDASFFEILTILAFEHFRRENCQVIVLETGLGGRLDSTNIIESPLLSVITSIGFDHMEILGDTLEKIAQEKAGIIKPNSLAVIGSRNMPIEVFKNVCNEKNAQLRIVEFNNDVKGFREYNQNIARTVLHCIRDKYEIPSYLLEKAMTRVPSCRFQIVLPAPGFPPTVLDIAHNPIAVEKLFDELKKTPEVDNVFVVGLSKNKDIDAILKVVQRMDGIARSIVFVRAKPRGEDPFVLLEKFNALEGSMHWDGKAFDDIEKGIEYASTTALNDGKQLVVFGTAFIMHSAKKWLGILPEGISQDDNEIL